MLKKNYSHKDLDWKNFKDIDEGAETTRFFFFTVIILVAGNFLVSLELANVVWKLTSKLSRMFVAIELFLMFHKWSRDVQFRGYVVYVVAMLNECTTTGR